MSTFTVETDGPSIRLRLDGELTIEHARELHAALVAAMHPDCALSVDATAVTRLDAAAVQVLIAAAAAAGNAVLVAPSPAWGEAFRRYALANPYGPPTP